MLLLSAINREFYHIYTCTVRLQYSHFHRITVKLGTSYLVSFNLLYLINNFTNTSDENHFNPSFAHGHFIKCI